MNQRIPKSLWILALMWVGLAQAQSFSVGAAVGLWPVADLRAGYEAPEFGLRAYYDLASSFGVDAYARLGNARLGGGVLFFGGEVVPRLLLGGVLEVAPNLVLALEYRPALLLGLWNSPGEERFAAVLGFMFFSIGLEYRI